VKSQEIYSQNGERYIGKKKFPRKIMIREAKLYHAVSTARYHGLTRQPNSLGPVEGREDLVWKDAVRSSGVYQEMPVEVLIQHVDQLPGGDRVDPPRAG
jgi:hypothetical protein